MRKEGFYWVKIHGRWTIGYFDKKYDNWDIVGSDEILEDCHFEIIGKQIIQEEIEEGF